MTCPGKSSLQDSSPLVTFDHVDMTVAMRWCRSRTLAIAAPWTWGTPGRYLPGDSFGPRGPLLPGIGGIARVATPHRQPGQPGRQRHPGCEYQRDRFHTQTQIENNADDRRPDGRGYYDR